MLLLWWVEWGYSTQSQVDFNQLQFYLKQFTTWDLFCWVEEIGLFPIAVWSELKFSWNIFEAKYFLKVGDTRFAFFCITHFCLYLPSGLYDNIHGVHNIALGSLGRYNDTQAILDSSWFPRLILALAWVSLYIPRDIQWYKG